MTGQAQTRAQYRAFISYSHKDAAIGRRLHRRLERYVLPRRLVGRLTARGPAPARLSPIFRDREELPAYHDLTEKVRAALAASDALVVVCSPEAAASPWVAREIETFRELHPDRPVLAALVAGRPDEAFPPALLRTRADGAVMEPLAADFRPASDGERLGLLKLVAGILDVGLDELVQRDAQRQMARVTAITAAAIAVALMTSLLTLYALRARAEALRQRAEAEGLIQFMLTDLRDRLEEVGRIDVMTPVNKRALAHYEQGSGPADSEAQLRQAMVLRALGSDDFDLGNMAEARVRFEKSYAITNRLLDQDGQDPERILGHAQSEFWMGYLSYFAGHRDEARTRFTLYRSLAQTLVTQQPENPRYLRELGFAEGGLCSAALVQPKDRTEAKRSCIAALAAMRKAATLKNPPPAIWLDIANREAWLADAYHESYDWPHALEHRREQEAILRRLIAASPHDLKLRARWVATQRGLAILEFETDHRAAANARQRAALAELNAMIAFDPANKSWLKLKHLLEADLSRNPAS